MPDSNVLNFGRLLDWIEGRLSAEEAAAVAQAIEQADDATRAELAWLRAFHGVSAKTLLAAPPADTHAALIQRFAEYAQRRRPPSLLRRLAATLTFDSGLQPAAAGVRGAGVQESARQLIYSVEIADIALNIQPRQQGQRVDLFGQILPKSGAPTENFSVELAQGGVTLSSAAADEFGEFIFEDLALGEYELGLRSQHVDVRIAPVELR
jgi:hypothetical protein